jgi:hypothetical protein
MKYLQSLLVVIGVCLGALGASGFHRPYESGADMLGSREPYALPLFILGCVSLVVGGVLTRRSRSASAGGNGEGKRDKASFARDIDAIRDLVVELDDQKLSLSAAEVHARIDRLMAEQYFDLTSKSDDLARLIGFSDYARVWEGIATGERLLNRCWSMITDDHPEEGLEELPLARRSIEQAAARMAELGGSTVSRPASR